MSYASVPSPVRPLAPSRFGPGLKGLGDACGPCMISYGGDCEICPDGAGDDFPECSGCVNGVRTSLVSEAKQSLWFPIVVGVVSTLAVTLLTYKILGKN